MYWNLVDGKEREIASKYFAWVQKTDGRDAVVMDDDDGFYPRGRRPYTWVHGTVRAGTDLTTLPFSFVELRFMELDNVNRAYSVPVAVPGNMSDKMLRYNEM